MPDHTFDTRKDLWLVLVVWASLVIPPCTVIVAATIDWPGWSTATLILLSCLAGPLVVLLMAWPIRYVIGADTLVVRAGLLLRWRIPLAQITSIEPRGTILASPSWSLRRICVVYRDSGGVPDELFISPQRQEEFFAAILERAPHLRSDGSSVIQA